MNWRNPFWRYLYLGGILLGLAGCMPLRPSSLPSPSLPPPSPSPSAILHAPAETPPTPIPEPHPWMIETLPIAPAKLSPQERRLYFTVDTGLPVYEVKNFPIPERKPSFRAKCRPFVQNAVLSCKMESQKPNLWYTRPYGRETHLNP